jgi:hypothetical protein
MFGGTYLVMLSCKQTVPSDQGRRAIAATGRSILQPCSVSFAGLAVPLARGTVGGQGNGVLPLCVRPADWAWQSKSKQSNLFGQSLS